MAVLPTRLIDIEFDAGVWTDVSSYVVDVSTRRGRNKESGAFETGQMVLRLRNDDRRFDPDHATGPYYGKLRPNRRVRFRATYNAVTYAVILGYIDQISQNYEGPNASTAEFQVSDIFKLLNRAELPSSALAGEILTDAPAHWWRLNDTAGSTVALPAAGAYSLTAGGAPEFGQSSLAVRDTDTAVRVGPSDYFQGIFPEGSFPFTTAGSLEYLYRDDGGTTTRLAGLYVLAASPYGVDPVDVSSNVRWLLVNSAGTSFDVSSTGVDVNDGETHHVVLTWSAGSNIKIYIDGVDRTAAAVTFSGTMANTTDKWAVILNGIDYPPFVSVGAGATAIVDEYALYTTALSAARVAAHNTAMRTPWDDDLPGTRLGRVLDLAAVPTADRNLDAGTTTLQSTSLGGSALAYAQKVEETEIGWLFVAKDGKVRFIGRNAGFAGTYLTSQATLVDDDSGAGLPYRFGDAEVDEAFLVTRATVSRDGSIAVTVYDAAAKTEFGWLDEVHDGLLHDSDAYSRSYAEWVVNTHKTPGTRLGALTMELPKDPATMYPAILALELADRVTYKRKPQNTGAVFTQDMRVEAISHATGGGYWHTTLQLSPFNLAASGYPVGVWDVTNWDQSVWGI